jgi:hypothetical protein
MYCAKDISGFCLEAGENYALVGYCAVISGHFFTDVSGQRISSILKGCVIMQKCTVLKKRKD